MSVVGDTAVRSRGVGARSAELEELARISAWKAAPKSERRCILTGLMFLTRVPCPGWCDHHPGFLILALAWFPTVGSIVGFWAGCVYDALWLFVPDATLCSIASLFATEFLTMCFHDDGLADAADAIAGGWSRQEIFTILKDSRLGTFGVIALILFLSAKIALISSLGRQPSHWSFQSSTGPAPILFVTHAMARATAAPLMYSCPYVLGEDDAKGEFYAWLGKSSRDLLSLQRVLFSSLSAFLIAVLTLGFDAAVVGFVVVGGVCAAAKWYGMRTLGGVQGDFLGATICVCEIVLYTAFVACSMGEGEALAFRLPPQLGDAASMVEVAAGLRPVLWLVGVAVALFRGVRVLL